VKVELNFKELVEKILNREVKKFNDLEIKEMLKRRLTKKEYKLVIFNYNEVSKEKIEKELSLDGDRYNKLVKSSRKKIFDNF